MQYVSSIRCSVVRLAVGAVVICGRGSKIIEKGKRQPESAIVAKFSIPYTGALAVLKQSVALGDFSEESLKNPEVLKLASKFTYEVNEHWGKQRSSRFKYQ